MVRFAATPLEVARTLRNRDIARGFPRYARWLKVLLAIEVAVLVSIGIFRPWLLLPILGLIALGSVWFTWQARPNRGHRKRWPPGSVGVGSQAMSDPDFYFKRWETYGPVFKANLFDQPAVYVVGVEAATELFHHHADALAPNSFAPWNRFIPGGLARWTAGEAHERYRRLLGGSLGARLISHNREVIREEVGRSLALMASGSEASGAVAPLPFIEDLVFGVWAKLFFGIPRTGDSYGALHEYFDVISIEKQARGKVVNRALEQLQQIVTRAFVAEDLADPDRLGDTLIGELNHRDSSTVSDPVTVINLIYLMETTSLDVAGLLMWVLKHAADNPEYLAQLRHEPGDPGPLSLANRMVSESVRLEQSEYLHRFATGDIEFRDLVIPKGWMVHACIHESHRDPRVFSDPDSYNPDRFLAKPSPTEYAPFGIDGRACVGVPLTREIARSFLVAIAGGYEMQIVQDGPRELSPHRHWAPSSEMRVALKGRQVPAGTDDSVATALGSSD